MKYKIMLKEGTLITPVYHLKEYRWRTICLNSKGIVGNKLPLLAYDCTFPSLSDNGGFYISMNDQFKYIKG